MQIPFIVHSLTLLGCLLISFSALGTMKGNKRLTETLLASPVTKHWIHGRPVYIKRDDLLNVYGLSGNKARKYLKLLQDVIADRDTNAPENYDQHHHYCYNLVSYGGIQSNSMLALSKIALLNPRYNFTYFSRAVPKFLKKAPIGNYLRALRHGTTVIELDNARYEDMASGKDVEMILRQNSINIETVNFIKQGGLSKDAEVGLHTLAKEIVDFVMNQSHSCDKNGWCVFVASGTGTSALYLNRAIQLLRERTDIGLKEKIIPIKVVAIPCMGSSEVLAKQMKSMNIESCYLPEILDDGTNDSHSFAQPCEQHLEIWRNLCSASGIDFDLIYAPRAWQQLRRVLSQYENMYNIMYYHCGGQEGNDSQLRRYKYKGIGGQ